MNTVIVESVDNVDKKEEKIMVTNENHRKIQEKLRKSRKKGKDIM